MLHRRSLLARAAAACAAVLWQPAARAASFRDITWLELVPAGWNPRTQLGPHDTRQLDDNDPRAKALMARLRAALDDAPTVAALDGARVRMPGYMVPLEQGKDGLREFLLVPYFGACVHTPPPPANQIVHVVAHPPVKDFDATDAVWASGTLKAARTDAGLAVSGYGMALAKLEPYRGP